MQENPSELTDNWIVSILARLWNFWTLLNSPDSHIFLTMVVGTLLGDKKKVKFQVWDNSSLRGQLRFKFNIIYECHVWIFRKNWNLLRSSKRENNKFILINISRLKRFRLFIFIFSTLRAGWQSNRTSQASLKLLQIVASKTFIVGGPMKWSLKLNKNIHAFVLTDFKLYKRRNFEKRKAREMKDLITGYFKDIYANL